MAGHGSRDLLQQLGAAPAPSFAPACDSSQLLPLQLVVSQYTSFRSKTYVCFNAVMGGAASAACSGPSPPPCCNLDVGAVEFATGKNKCTNGAWGVIWQFL